MAKDTGGAVSGSALAVFKKHASLSDTLSELRKNKEFKKSVDKSMSTGRVKLQQNRETLAEKASWLRTISDELFSIENQIATLTERLGQESDGGDEEQKEKTRRLIAIKTIEAQRLMNLAQLTLMGGYLDGLGLQVDCLTIEEPCKVKTSSGEVVLGKRRVSVAELMMDLGEDVEAIAVIVADYIHPMLRDIGVKQQAFVNEHGTVMPGKYDLPHDEIADEEELVSENDAVTVRPESARTVDEMRQELSRKPEAESVAVKENT
jgi:hypothetical protein